MDQVERKMSEQKDKEGRNGQKTSNIIKFNIEKKNIECFMSSTAPLKPNSNKSLEKQKNNKQPQTNTLTFSFEYQPGKKKISFDSPLSPFNNKLLLMQYGTEEVYIDSSKQKNSHKQIEEAKNSSSEGEDELVTSCVKVITEETDNTSNPMTARYNPLEMANEYNPYLYQPYLEYPMQGHNHRRVGVDESNIYKINVKLIEKDGRTTLMLRNIPNKYTRDMILDEIDRLNFKKKYDFFYLPIDYKNQCNVGYAFINFLHTKFIEEFYNQFHHKKWQKFNSEKICQVCYARIQGTAQLLTHFKDSNVINQKDKKLRPLIDLSFSSLADMVERQKTNLSNKKCEE